MIKFVGNGIDGVKIVGLGFSARNLALLMNGKPMTIRFKDMPGMELPENIEILIFAGETEQAMVEDFKRNGIELPPFQEHRDDEEQERGK